MDLLHPTKLDKYEDPASCPSSISVQASLIRCEMFSIYSSVWYWRRADLVCEIEFLRLRSYSNAGLDHVKWASIPLQHSFQCHYSEPYTGPKPERLLVLERGFSQSRPF